MSLGVLRNPEYRGWLILALVILGVGVVFAVATGKLQQWFGISFGPKALDRIIFVSDSTGSPEIYSMSNDGTDRKQLTTGARVRSAPAISSVGDRIAYVGRFANSNQVFSIGAEGGRPDRLTSATGPKKEPRYTPDGRNLSFISSGVVYVAETNGDSPHPILPTLYEARAAMANPLRRNEVPAYYSYAWGPDSAAIVGIARDPAGNDTVVYLANSETEPKPMGSPDFPWARLLNELVRREGAPGPRIAPDEAVRVTGASWAANAPAFALSVVAGNDSFLLVFGVSKRKVGIGGFKSFKGHEIGSAAFAPDGSAVVVPINPRDGKSRPGLLRVDLRIGMGQMIASGAFSMPSYSPKGDRVLATLSDEIRQTRNVVTIDLATGKTNQLTRDGGSYDAIWSPMSDARGSR